MNYLSRLWASGLLALGCAAIVLLQTLQTSLALPAPMSTAQPLNSPVAQINANSDVNFEPFFQDLGVTGSILIYDVKQEQTYQHNPERNATPFLPASTYKILNSLIALETGVIPNEIAILTWDGIERMIPDWNQDLNMREAFKRSAVWFYQVLARKIGHERMQQWVTQVGYGNQTIGAADDIDRFWLEGELRITPQEQIQFLRRLYQNDLPFSERSLSIVKDIMIAEQTPDYTMRVKTGWAGLGESDQPQIGWYVGYLERDDNAYLFATNIEIQSDADAPKRAVLTRRCFEQLGLL